MSTELDDRLRGLFTDLADATPVETPSRFWPERVPYAGVALDRPRRAKRLVLAGVAAAVILIVGLVVILHRDDKAKVSTSAIPSSDPVLWVPDTSSGTVSLASYSYAQMNDFLVEAGAVRAPDGTVFEINVNAGQRPGVADRRELGGRTVFTDPVDPTGLTTTYSRWMSFGCSTFDVMSRDEDVWSSDTVALLNGVAILDGKIRVELPPGWKSLGEARSERQFGISFVVTVGATTQVLYMWEMPDTPVGFYLGTAEAKPQPVDVAGRPGWLVETSRPRSTTLIAERDGTAFFIGGDGVIPASLLIDIAKALVRAPKADWTLHNAGISNPTTTPASGGCQAPGLEIHSNP